MVSNAWEQACVHGSTEFVLPTFTNGCSQSGACVMRSPACHPTTRNKLVYYAGVDEMRFRVYKIAYAAMFLVYLFTFIASCTF